MTLKRRLCPPPRCRAVSRPVLLRPPDFGSGPTSDCSGRSFVISLKSNPVRNRRPGDVGRNWMIGIASGSLEEVDPAALGEGDVGLLPVGTASLVPADAPHLAHLAVGADLRDLHLEERLDGLADLRLVGAGVDAEHDLVAQLVHQRALLGDDRTLDDVGGGHAGSFAAPAAWSGSPRRAAICSIASRVMMRVACPRTSYTLRPSARMTFTCGRFRPARCTASSRPPSTTSALPSMPSSARQASICFVFGSASASRSTTTSLPSACRAPMAARSAAARAERGSR